MLPIPKHTVAGTDAAGNAIYREVVAVLNLDGSAVSSSGGSGSGSSIADNMVVDAVGIYWIVRDSGSTLTYVKLSTGSLGTPTAPVRPLTDRDPVQFTYKVKAAFTDVSVTGAIPVDALLVRVAWLDTTGSAPSAAFSSWFYKGTVLAAAPLDANIEFVDATSGGTTKTSDQVQYQVKTVFGTLAAGTILTKVSLFDTASTGSLVVYWFKQTGVAVSPTDIALIVEGTNVIAQSEQVDTRMVDSAGALVTETNPLPVSLKGASKYSNYVFVQSEDVADTTYVLKTDGVAWLMTKIVSTATTDVATYAGIGNNAAITLATAWSNKAALVYGSIAAV
jgi:hypothetical protein